MKLFLLLLLPFESQADYPGQYCFTGNILIGNETWTEDDLMAALMNDVNAAVLTVANHDPKLANFLRQQGNCQADCLATTIRPTFSALYGKLAEDFVNHDKKYVQDMFTEAITGAFTACYPHPPRQEVMMVAETIFAGIGAPYSPSKPFPAGVECPNEGHEDYFPLNEFLDQFHNTIMAIIGSNPEMQRFFDLEAKDCQKSCLQHTVPASAMTLFLINNYDEYTGLDALTGAIHACFPGVPHEDINILVHQTNNVMARAEEQAAAEAARRWQQGAETQRRYRGSGGQKAYRQQAQWHEEVQPEASTFSSLGGFSFIGAMTLAVVVGVLVGRRWERPGSYAKQQSSSGSSYQMVPSMLGRKDDSMLA